MQQYYFLILLALVFVVLIVLPGRQRKKVQAQQQQLQNSLQPGTPVMTTAGLHGTVAGLGEGTVDLEIAPGVVTTFERRAILQVRQPVAGPGATAAGTSPTGPVPGTTSGVGPTEIAPEPPRAPGEDTPGAGDGPADRTR